MKTPGLIESPGVFVVPSALSPGVRVGSIEVGVADEEAFRFGDAGGDVLHSATADDYPGIGKRNSLDDGHFVSVAAIVVPEPGTPLLLVAGFLGLAGWRRASA
jgi:PEP-CTERM motif-containing protein